MFYIYIRINRSNFSVANDECERKVILNQGIKITDDHSMESDDDQKVVDTLSPQTLLETPIDNDIQYSYRSPEGICLSYILLNSINLVNK